MKLKRVAALVLTGAICFTTLFGCGANAQDTIATLGEENISFGVANFLVKYQKSQADDYYTMYASVYGVDSLWDLDADSDGLTEEESLKEGAMDLLHDMHTLKAHMADYGVEITAEDEAAMKEAANAFLAANTEDAIKEFGATEEIVTEVLKLYTIQAKMYNEIIVDTNREVSDEEANMRGYSMLFVSKEGKYDDNNNWVKYTEEELAEIDEIISKIQLDVKLKSLETIAKEYDYEVTTGAYKKQDTSLDVKVLTALDALKEGEVSSAVETEAGTYFLRIDTDTDKEATEENRQSIIVDRENALYEEVIAKWQENDGWDVNESLVEKIEFHNKFTIYKETEENESTEAGTESADVSETVDGEESN